ncbi:MAG: hypothetical protein AAF628_33580 [Planctomycetota bacterium]
MEVDLTPADGINDYITVPAGSYVCEIAEVRPGTTRAGDPRWGIRLIVAEGEYTGRQAAWDGLVFSRRGRARVRRILGALGLPNQGKVDLAPADVEGRRALVEVRPSEFEDPSGETVRRNEVPYDGYRPIPDAPTDASPNSGREPPAVDPAEIPF